MLSLPQFIEISLSLCLSLCHSGIMLSQLSLWCPVSPQFRLLHPSSPPSFPFPFCFPLFTAPSLRRPFINILFQSSFFYHISFCFPYSVPSFSSPPPPYILSSFFYLLSLPYCPIIAKSQWSLKPTFSLRALLHTSILTSFISLFLFSSLSSLSLSLFVSERARESTDTSSTPTLDAFKLPLMLFYNDRSAHTDKHKLSFSTALPLCPEHPHGWIEVQRKLARWKKTRSRRRGFCSIITACVAAWRISSTTSWNNFSQTSLREGETLIHYSKANLKIALIFRLRSEGLFIFLYICCLICVSLSVCVRHSQPGVTLTCGRLALRSRISKRTSEMASSSCCCSRSSQVSVLTRLQVRNSNKILQKKKQLIINH